MNTLRADLACFAALLVLLAITVAVAFLHLGPLNTSVSLLIAGMKAALIAMIFMRIRSATPLVRIFAAAGLFWLMILLALTLSDYLTRAW